MCAFVPDSIAAVKMSELFGKFTTREEVDIKPDISLLCCNALPANIDFLDVKLESSEVLNDNSTPTTGMSSCNADVDIKPAISLLCCNTLPTNSDSLDVKPDVHSDGKPTTSCYYTAVVPTDGDVEPDEGEFDVKPLACVQCNNLLSSDDAKLNMVPLVLLKPFDVTKLVYPLPNVTSQSSNLPSDNNNGVERREVDAVGQHDIEQVPRNDPTGWSIHYKLQTLHLYICHALVLSSFILGIIPQYIII